MVVQYCFENTTRREHTPSACPPFPFPQSIPENAPQAQAFLSLEYNWYTCKPTLGVNFS